MCDVKTCRNLGYVMIEGGAVLCENHERMMKPVQYVCKFCKVPVISKDDRRPVLGKVHKKCCPRRRTHR